MTYDEALNFIHGAYGMGEKHGLDNMRRLAAMLCEPQRAFPSIHVAGTNGKGSVCAFLYAMLACAGYRVGLYTSPYLQRYNERIRVDGAPISDAALAECTERVAAACAELHAQGVRPTEFEIGTAVAFSHFAREKVDVAVVEVGLGGRLDPTNILTPRVCVIASIGLDHMQVLGDTVVAIAREKAGIAKPRVPLVLSSQANNTVRDAVRAACEAVGAPYSLSTPETRGYALGLEGAHQRFNADAAVCALRLSGFDVPEDAIREGLRRVRWPARLEWLADKPRLLLDGAHNPQGARSLAQYVAERVPGRKALLCGVMRDKAWREIVEVFSDFADAAVTVAPDNHRALDAETLAGAFAEHGVHAQAANSMEEGYALARRLAGEGGVVVAAGSLYLAGELRTLVCGLDDGLLKP